jgi:hypothetical protein
MRSFQIGWFFLHRDGYALANEASSLHTFVTTEPPSPIGHDCRFAYACDVAENRGRIVELPFGTFGSSKLCNEFL